MQPTDSLVGEVRRALASEPDLGPEVRALHLSVDHENTLTIEGEVPSISVKKKVLRRAASASAVNGIVDRIHVAPAVTMEDRQIRSHLLRAFDEEAALSDLDLRNREDGTVKIHRQVLKGRRGFIEIEVSNGVVLLDGEVPGLDDKRLAGVLTWWIPGVRDVVNGIAVEPPEEDGPDMIEDSVKLALQMDPSIDASHIRVGVRHTMVRLTGLVTTEAQRVSAENDAWAVFGVDHVIDELRISHASS